MNAVEYFFPEEVSQADMVWANCGKLAAPPNRGLVSIPEPPKDILAEEEPGADIEMSFGQRVIAQNPSLEVKWLSSLVLDEPESLIVPRISPDKILELSSSLYIDLFIYKALTSKGDIVKTLKTAKAKPTPMVQEEDNSPMSMEVERGDSKHSPGSTGQDILDPEIQIKDLTQKLNQFEQEEYFEDKDLMIEEIKERIEQLKKGDQKNIS